MLVHDLPEDWLRPGSRGYRLIAGDCAAQVLLLIPCAACNLPLKRKPTGCPNCADGLVPGFMAMRCGLPELVAALRRSDTPVPGAPPSAAQAMFTGALSDTAALIVLRGVCPTCTGELVASQNDALVSTAARCQGTCGTIYQIFIDHGPHPLVVAEIPSGPNAYS